MLGDSNPSEACAVNVFVSGLPKDMTEDQLRLLCAPCGPLLNVKLMINVKSGASRGFGFALFADADTASRAVAHLSGMSIPPNHTLHAEISKHEAGNILLQSDKVLVRNVPCNMTDDEVKSYFSTFGRVVAMRSKRDSTTRRRMVLVHYESGEAATASVAACDNQRPFAQCHAPLIAKLFKPRGLDSMCFDDEEGDFIPPAAKEKVAPHVAPPPPVASPQQQAPPQYNSAFHTGLNLAPAHSPNVMLQHRTHAAATMTPQHIQLQPMPHQMVSMAPQSLMWQPLHSEPSHMMVQAPSMNVGQQTLLSGMFPPHQQMVTLMPLPHSQPMPMSMNHQPQVMILIPGLNAPWSPTSA